MKNRTENRRRRGIKGKLEGSEWTKNWISNIDLPHSDPQSNFSRAKWILINQIRIFTMDRINLRWTPVLFTIFSATDRYESLCFVFFFCRGWGSLVGGIGTALKCSQRRDVEGRTVVGLCVVIRVLRRMCLYQFDSISILNSTY